MTDTSNVKLTITFINPDLDDEEKDEEVQKLQAQMKELAEVEEVNRVSDPNPPTRSKGFVSFLTGLLMAEVSPANIKKLFGFLSERLGNKPIKIAVKAPDGREITVEASSKEEFDFAMQKALDFLNNN
ncbi:hypothetical protein [Iningainema tapete]|uniref:Uncharacterized protein n=1 Tax=Iningainema tapete BLCC-T55 TaxID=2748662 RepID=A0A8J6XX95_9CYAN|nr:hypothetical protein [Iningainema tapete]MBD2778057.1 hypothetical protein [Iningainema tapete BLCC-T55]